MSKPGRRATTRCLGIVVTSLGLSVWVTGCIGDSEKAAATDPGAVACAPVSADCAVSIPSYAAAVQPILDLKCGPCHSPDTPGGPWPLDNYEDVSDWSFAILNELDGCLLTPPHSNDPLSYDERSVLNAWFSCGAPDN